ncbi:hypothetical protein Hte_006903 [Hypoxylon texense]
MASPRNSNGFRRVPTTQAPSCQSLAAAHLAELIGDEQQDHIQQRLTVIRAMAANLTYLLKKLKARPESEHLSVLRLTELHLCDEEDLDQLGLELEIVTVKGNLVAQLLPEEDHVFTIYDPFIRPRHIDGPYKTERLFANDPVEYPDSASISGDEDETLGDDASFDDKTLVRMLYRTFRRQKRSIDFLKLQLVTGPESFNESNYLKGIQLLESSTSVLGTILSRVGQHSHPRYMSGVEEERRVDDFIRDVWVSL